ncbi:hypothetical protein PsorP6_014913 [Peronosclerospora sorghi]|uniref:Uncharacterized protein n=1 Tax=Peronosclerospora sorghi TaxID=230839 RepID=A0ACC0VTD4_9STRA|nr:hypothetical protein PsorP6_014913 [Peronosclerospora sorghi]
MAPAPTPPPSSPPSSQRHVDMRVDFESAQHELALLSRVQAVSRRRRHSDRMDDHDDSPSPASQRASLVSHYSFTAARASCSERCGPRPLLHRASRWSLPGLESRADEEEDASSPPRVVRPCITRGQRHASNRLAVGRTSHPGHHHYIAPPASPVPSSASARSQSASVSERTGTVLTEVGDAPARFGLAFVHAPRTTTGWTMKKSTFSRRTNLFLDDDAVDNDDAVDDDDAVDGRTPSYPIALMHLYLHGAPHVSIDEAHKYTFAIILHHTEQVFHVLKRRFPSRSTASLRRELPQLVTRLQVKCVRRLIQAGLGVLLLDDHVVHEPQSSTKDTTHGVPSSSTLPPPPLCLLIDPKKTPDLLLHEFKRELDELAIQRGDALARLAEASLDSLKALCFSPALELQLTHNIITNAWKDYDKDEWVSAVNKELTVTDVVAECFPLHDRAFNRQFFAEYRNRTFGEWSLRHAAAGNSERWAVEELRLHFGERVAFLFAFMHIYTKHLVPLTLACLVYYLAFRFMSSAPVWRQYMQGLALLGLGVVCFWGPSFLVCWARETRLLVEKWHLAKYQNTVYEKNDENPGFQYVWVKNHVTHEMEKIPRQRQHQWIQLTMLLFVLVCALIQCLCLVPFIQWYVYAKNAPTCDACNGDNDDAYPCMWFITCFNASTSALGTDRWVYILIQGIVLGLLIDIFFFELFNWMSEKFVQWENYARKSEHENRLIHRRFVFVWTNWFFWFLFLSFVYMPFGATIVTLFHRLGFGALAPYAYKPNLLTLDTLFVTPLVVTQLLNMVLETIAPYLLRKLRGRPSLGCRQASPLVWCLRHVQRWVRRQATSGAADPGAHVNAARLAHLVQRDTGFVVPVRPTSDDSNQYAAYEILAEAKLPVFDPVLDYLDACIQFSYVMMFTVVWPLLPVPAFVNNILEVRGDAFRLLFANRRPMPRRDTSIGEWATVLAYANIIGVTVVSAFVVVYHAGYFRTQCNFTFTQGYVIPFGTIQASDTTDPRACVNESGEPRWLLFQIVLFVVLEHVGFCLRYLVLQVDTTPALLRSSGYQRLKQIQHLTATKAASPAQLAYVERLRVVFDTYDRDGDGHVVESELVQVLAAWVCKHPSELLPYAGLIFRYMDKPKLGKVPFATCCLMMQHVNHDRFFSCLLGLYDPLHGAYNDAIRRTSDPMELQRVLSHVSSEVQPRRSTTSRDSDDTDVSRPRDSTFFYVDK